MFSNVSEIKEENIDCIEDLVISPNSNGIKEFFYTEEKSDLKYKELKETICDLTFVSKTDVDLDYLYIDETIIDKFQCITCNKLFLDLQSLSQHTIICGLNTGKAVEGLGTI